MTERSFANLLQRSIAAGLTEEEFRRDFLPDWWCDEAEADVGVLYEVEFTLARCFHGWDLDTVRDPSKPLPFVGTRR